MFDEEVAHVSRAETETTAGRTAPPPSWREAHRQLQRIARRRGALDAEEARWLLAARAACVHVELGYGTFPEYLERLLGYAPRTARERVRVAEELEALPAIRDALGRGAVSFCAVRALTRVAEAETEGEWLRAIAGKTIREIEDAVRGRAKGDRPNDPSDPSVEPRRLGLELAPEVYAAWLQARRHLEDEAGAPLDDSAIMAALCRGVLDPRPPAASATHPRHHLAVTVCERCDRATVDAAGQVIDVGPEALALARCDAAHVGRVDAPGARTTIDIPRKTRRHVERRDHGRCTVPGCRSSRGLEIHHVVERARGGGHDASNLTLACQHHHLSVHAGRLRITGTAPDQLRFEHTDGRPYGADPVGGDLFVEAMGALRTMGFSAGEAAAAVERARAQVDPASDLETVIRASLRQCLPPLP
jgi:hypothetical protein